jgi:hypothetical protein
VRGSRPTSVAIAHRRPPSRSACRPPPAASAPCPVECRTSGRRDRARPSLRSRPRGPPSPRALRGP